VTQIGVSIRQHPTGSPTVSGGSDHVRTRPWNRSRRPALEAVPVPVAKVRDLATAGASGGDDRRSGGWSGDLLFSQSSSPGHLPSSPDTSLGLRHSPKYFGGRTFSNRCYFAAVLLEKEASRYVLTGSSHFTSVDCDYGFGIERSKRIADEDDRGGLTAMSTSRCNGRWARKSLPSARSSTGSARGMRAADSCAAPSDGFAVALEGHSLTSRSHAAATSVQSLCIGRVSRRLFQSTVPTAVRGPGR